ncbi:hypothetical protein Avbf_14182 [Armadillidium vulgare]|nr:hypothetical protein Avbf_14182 [Armadillidium vulgare]
MTNFGDLSKETGIKSLNDYLADKSFIEGFTPSQADASVFESLGKAPSSSFPHSLRWYNLIASYGDERKSFPGKKLDLSAAKSTPAPTSSPAPAATPVAKDDDDDDDVDLFASDDEEDAEAARVREERLKAYAEKKTKKPGPIAKSQILLDCKPWDDETDMKAMEDIVRTISMEGLVWGASKLNPLAFGINKLSILCTVVDDLVSVDDLIEKITEFEDYVQSVDIAAFNKV